MITDEIKLYMEKDRELRIIEKEINNSADRVNGKKLGTYLKEAEEMLNKFEVRSAELADKSNVITANYNKALKTLTEYQKAYDDAQDAGELVYLQKKLKEVSDSVNSLERECKTIITEINDISVRYDEYRGKIPQVRAQYLQCKASFDVLVKAKQPTVSKIREELATLEKVIPRDIIERYKLIKQQGIYPPFVPFVDGQKCGGCGMQVPSAQASKIDEHGFITCENCRRVMYKVD
ncbi:MAG: C4-type zinc ribbon domain-containing protein [Clostridia bacterium]